MTVKKTKNLKSHNGCLRSKKFLKSRNSGQKIEKIKSHDNGQKINQVFKQVVMSCKK